MAAVRDVAERFRPYAKIFVGGVPMIAADMMAFVRSDLVTFGTAILAVMAVVLWLIFRSWKWVFIPLITCSATATLLLGVLAGTDWRMTVISSNSVAVLLIVTLSLSIHLVVRYRELQRQRPDAPREQLSAGASKPMLVPCLYGHDHHCGIYFACGRGPATRDRFWLDDDHRHRFGFLFPAFTVVPP